MISRRNFLTITVIMLIVFFLFQLSGVIKENWNDYETNEYADTETKAYTASEISVPDEAESAAQGRLAVYIGNTDTTGLTSVVTQWGLYSKHCLKTYDSLAAYEADAAETSTPQVLLLDSGSLDWGSDTARLENYAKQGIHLIFCNLPEPSVIAQNDTLKKLLGIEAVKSEETTLSGIHLFSGLLLGGEAIYSADTEEEEEQQDLDLSVPWYQTASGTKTYMAGMLTESELEKIKAANGENKGEDEIEDEVKNGGLPAIIWRNSVGTAQIFAVNGDYLSDNTGIGILSGMMYEMGDYDLYPVVNAQSLVVVNYPQVGAESEAEEEMQERYSRSLKAVFRDIIWPGIAAVCENSNEKLTCLLNPQLGTQSSSALDDEALIYYYKLLREAHAEIGLSSTRLSEVSISEKLEQDGAFLNRLVPGYSYLSFYIGQMSEAEVQQALSKRLLEQVRTLYTDYGETDALFSYETENVTRQASTVDGFSHTYSEDLREKSLETALGYSSISIDMKRVVYPESEADSWEKLYEKFSSNTDTYWKSFTAFDKTTLEESDTRIRNFLHMSETDTRKGDTIYLEIDGFDTQAFYILRTHDEEIASIEGGSYEQIETGAYLIEAAERQVEIHLKAAESRFYYDEEETVDKSEVGQ